MTRCTVIAGDRTALEGCGACHTLEERSVDGLGIVRTGGWLMQTPLFLGYAGTAAYHPGARVAIGGVATFREGAFDGEGGYRNASTTICRHIGELLVPLDPPLQS